MSGELGKVLEWNGQAPVVGPVKRALGKLVDALEKAEYKDKTVPPVKTTKEAPA